MMVVEQIQSYRISLELRNHDADHQFSLSTQALILSLWRRVHECDISGEQPITCMIHLMIYNNCYTKIACV